MAVGAIEAVPAAETAGEGRAERAATTAGAIVAEEEGEGEGT